MAGDIPGSFVRVHEFSDQLTNKNVFFQVLSLKDSFHLWVGFDRALGTTVVAINTPYEKMPIATCLMGDQSDQWSLGLGQRLAKKTGKQVFVSCSVSTTTDQTLLPLLEKRICEEMARNPHFF